MVYIPEMKDFPLVLNIKYLQDLLDIVLSSAKLVSLPEMPRGSKVQLVTHSNLGNSLRNKNISESVCC